MHILLTGATGYIGKRLLPILIESGHRVTCCVRDKNRFTPPKSLTNDINVIEVDFLNKESLKSIPQDIDGAYYLMHSMSSSDNYQELESNSANNFKDAVSDTAAKHVIYLSGIINENNLSKHLSSRKEVEDILSSGTYNLTTLRAGIIIGSGSGSFEIIRDIVEKLPVMITPKWLYTQSQPIAVGDVISYLEKSLFVEELYNNNYDIGGPDVLTYKSMILQFAEIRKLRRFIITLPVMSPKLSSYWLYFVTATSFKLASALVQSMKISIICRPNNLNTLLDIQTKTYKEAIEVTLQKVEANQIVSSWKDSLVSGRFKSNLSDFLRVPTFGCFTDIRTRTIRNKKDSLNKIWNIGGNTGWYYASFLWEIRGFIDKIFGGVGLRRGRTSMDALNTGDSVDFWRVLFTDKEEGRLLLFAEMKLPGEAWLEFKIVGDQLIQTATFRPKGVAGRLYWYSVLPFHEIVFRGLASEIAK